MKKLFLLFVLSVLIISCGEYYDEKSKFIEKFKEKMHDPSSFELIEFTHIHDAYEMSDKHKKQYSECFDDKDCDGSKLYERITKLERSFNEDYGYTKFLAVTRGKNTFGAVVKNSHVVLFTLSNRMMYIDGEQFSFF